MSKTTITAEPGKQEIIITSVIDAPRDLVWKAYTDPTLIAQWLGPKRLTTKVEKMDVKPGGSWRFIHSEADGAEYGFHGVLHDLVEPERIVRTFEFEGVPGHVSLETATFEEQDGKTKVTSQAVFQSVEDRDGMLQSGMESGVNEGMERLTELLDRLRK